jgi:hypothetical protein
LWPHSESDDNPEKKPEADGQGTIKRRYREFMELHHRLLCGSFAPLMKGTMVNPTIGNAPNSHGKCPHFSFQQQVHCIFIIF